MFDNYMLIINAGLAGLFFLLFILIIKAAYQDSRHHKIFAGCIGFVSVFIANSVLCRGMGLRLYITMLIYRNYLYTIPIGIAAGIASYHLSMLISSYIYNYFVLSALKRKVKKGEKYSQFNDFMEQNGENVIFIEPHYGTGGFCVSYVPSGKIFTREHGILQYNDAQAKKKIFFEIDKGAERYWTTDEENALNDIVDEAAEKFGLDKQNNIWIRPLVEKSSVLKDPY